MLIPDATILRVRRSLDDDLIGTVVHASDVSLVDYCVGLLAGAPKEDDIQAATRLQRSRTSRTEARQVRLTTGPVSALRGLTILEIMHYTVYHASLDNEIERYYQQQEYMYIARGL